MSMVLTTLNESTMPPEVRNLLNSADGAAFEQALDVLVRQREQTLFRALGLLARDLHGAVSRLGQDLAHGGVPGKVADVRKHLNDVLEMSAEAAHRSIDFAERMTPEADALAQNAEQVVAWAKPGDPAAVLANQAVAFAANCREGLTDMVLAQSWQDLSGQRIKKVVNFIESVESSLMELVHLTGALAGREPPQVVEKIAGQDEADRLLSEFGF
jgi:chemotaxis protein CheZ